MSEENEDVQEPSEKALINDENVESSTTTESPTDSETDTSEPKRNKVQERINQLTREKYEERQKREEVEKRLVDLEAKQSQQQPNETSSPREDDFDDYDQFQQAQTEYAAQLAADKAFERLQAEQQSNKAKEAEKSRQQQLIDKKAKFDLDLESKRNSFEDFENVAYGHQFMDTQLAELVFESEKGPEVAYYLGSHLDEAQRIFSLDPVNRAKELTKLEFQVKPVESKKVSGAPDPIEPLGGNDSVEKSPDKMTTEEWLAWRNANKKIR